MNFLKWSCVFFIILFCLENVCGQDFEQNQYKYWQYRDRLTNQFMIVGEGQGRCMPAEYIDTTSGTMKWADNTVWLGWYIGTLATEYKLLTNPYYLGPDFGDSIRLQKNKDELYYALKALIRLDAVAETHFPSPCTNTPNLVNGFFIRDDVPTGFDSLFNGFSIVKSDYNNNGLYINEMSQDQAYHILLGLSLVKHFIPDSLQVNGFNIKQEAIAQALLIGEVLHSDNWTVKNPACQNKNVDRGADAILLAQGTNKLIQFISDGSVDYTTDVGSLSLTTWTSVKDPAILSADNMHMVMTLAALGNGWGSTTLNDLMVLAEVNRWHAYTLLHVALYDTNSVSNYQQHKPEIYFWTDSMLNEAPPQGPYTTFPNDNDHGYGVNNRFIRPRVDHYSSSSVSHFWNGLDYMLLYNLSNIVNPIKWEPDTTLGIPVNDMTSIFFYPNPVKDVIVFSKAVSAIEVFTLQGKLVAIDKGVNISLKQLKQGVYILKINDGGFTTTRKIIKL